MDELLTSRDFMRGREEAMEGKGEVEEVGRAPFLDRCGSLACGRKTYPRPRGCSDPGRRRPPPPPLLMWMCVRI